MTEKPIVVGVNATGRTFKVGPTVLEVDGKIMTPIGRVSFPSLEKPIKAMADLGTAFHEAAVAVMSYTATVQMQPEDRVGFRRFMDLCMEAERNRKPSPRPLGMRFPKTSTAVNLFLR